MELKDAKTFVDYYKDQSIKFWHKNGDAVLLKAYQLIRFLKLKLYVCKVRLHETTHLAIKRYNQIELVDNEAIAQKFITYVEDYFPDDKGILSKTMVLDLIVGQSTSYYNNKVFNHLPIYNVTIKPDTKDTCYLTFAHQVVKITKHELQQIPYHELDIAVFNNRKIDRRFKRNKNKLRGDYVKFVWNLSGHSPYRFKVFCTVLGYLIHNYKDPANPKMVILIDQVIGELEAANGGSGKSLFFKAIGHIRNLVELSGKKLQSNSRFAFQRIDVWIDVILVNDASKTENLENWYNITADGFMTERKYEKEQFIPHHLSPKICLSSNHMIRRPEGNSSERRVHEIEVSDYYGKDLSPNEEFERNLFGDEWTDKDWREFDNFIVFCVQYYLQFGLLTPPKINILKRKLIAEVGIELIEFMDDKITQGITKFHKKDTYDEFVKGGFINRKYIPQRNSFTRKLKKFFEYKQLNYTETPSDSKKYLELLTDVKIEDVTTQTLKDKVVDYKLVDTPNKLTRLDNTLKTL
ncbi:primase-helicase family protein [Winogradskyella sp. 4-2091]|uniref:primase-helicase family protein n=1 Tax=Winogradskyella sp. 4-2091 TaxID=3381659 RepID=UPI003891894F